MNKERRAKLRDVCLKLDDIKDIVQECAQEEMDARESLPEGLQASTQGIAMEEAGSTLDDIVGTLQDVIDSINGVI